jgi:hypothetical protein
MSEITRGPEPARPRLATTSAWCSLLLLLAIPATSRALCAAPMCSCAAGPGDFLIPTGAEIPADSRGIPFSGSGHLRWDGREMQLLNSDLFTVDRLQDGRWVRLRAVVEVLDGPMISDGANHQIDRLILVSPVGGFVRGGQYLFTHYPAYDWHDPQPRKVVVVVSELSFAELIDEEPPSLVVGEAVREAMFVETGGSCSTEIDAAAVPLRIELPTRLQRWQDVLLFSVVVDGEQIWRPQASLCADVPPGYSWKGRSRELLFSDCSAPDRDNQRLWAQPHDGLDPGLHRVEMSAWWPGIEARASAATVVELSCGAPGSSSNQRE